MKFNKISFMALAVAGVLVGCSDEAKYPYTEGAQSPGAYFATTLPKVVEVSDDATEVAIPVRRVGTQTASATITASGDTELFTIPTSVSFSGDAEEANLMIGYKAADMEYDKKYDIVLTITDASTYGMAEYRVAIVRPAPIVREVIHEYKGPGEGAVYTYSAMFTGDDPDLGVAISYNTLKPDEKIYEISPFALWEEEDGSDGAVLKIYVDTKKTLPADPTIGRPEGCYCATVPATFVFYVSDDGHVTLEKSDRAVYIEDEDVWYSRLFPDEYDGRYKGTSYFNPETGLFTLSVGYTMPYFEEGLNYYGEGIEYCQLPGYPDYSLSVEYEGFMTAASGQQSYAMFNVTTGPDFDEVLVVNIEGKETETAVTAVVEGAMEYEKMGPSETKEFRMPIEGSGDYTAIAVGMRNNEMVRVAVASYTIGGGVVENKDWLSLGEAEYIDGFVLPGYQFEDGTGVNPYDYPYYVEVKEHKDVPGLYKLVAPYSQENSPLGSLNEETGVYDIIVNAQNPDFVYLEPQYSGWDFGDGDGKMTIYDIIGMYIGAGWDLQEVIDKITGKQSTVDEWSTDEDGVITITPCIFDAFGGEGYSWKVGYSTEIWMPGTYTPAQAAAKRVKRAANHSFRFNTNADLIQMVKDSKFNRPLRLQTADASALYRR